MRFYLDTNILIFLRSGDTSELSCDVLRLLNDYENILQTSSECVQEFIHLKQIKKITLSKKKDYSPESIISWLEEMGIEIVPVNKVHLTTYAKLPLYENHRDPNDQLIIAQAICDKVPLISSDRKFSMYQKHGLQFVFNER